MAKKPAIQEENTLLDKTEQLLNTLVDEASTPPEEGRDGPDFSERLKVVEAVTRFSIVRNKLVPQDKKKSMFEELQNELHGGETGSHPAAPAGKARNGHGFTPTAVEDDDEL